MQITSRLVPGLVGLAGVVAIGGLALPGAAASPARVGGTCGPTNGYIDATSATVSGSVVVVHGRRATLHCGGPDDSSYRTHEKITLTMSPDATAKVWKVPADPNGGTRIVSASELPKWIKRNRSEPIYRITGPRSGVTKLVEQWHP